MLPARPTVSAALSRTVEAIDIMQATYKESKGQYWQGIRTKSDDTRKASDHPSWKTKRIDLTDLQEDVSVHTYNGPRGHGYIVIIEIAVTGGVYSKSLVKGEEKERAHDWQFNPDDYVT